MYIKFRNTKKLSYIIIYILYVTTLYIKACKGTAKTKDSYVCRSGKWNGVLMGYMGGPQFYLWYFIS